MTGTHQSPLVALSFLIAICASYTALTLAGRVAVARGRARLAWLLGGSIAMGSGIWSMHFVAMLAFRLPIPISYDVPLVAASWLAAVGASAFALFVASRTQVSKVRLAAAGTCLGLAVVTMHYTGMAAVRVQAHLGYKPMLVAASVAIAITASTVALLLFIWLRTNHTRRGSALRAAAAVVMGVAIAGMHYTAMAAAHFTDVGIAHAPSRFLLASSGLAVPVVMGAFVILTLTVAGTLTDHWVRMKLLSAEALRESEERYRSVVSEIDEVIFRTDADARWTFLNPAWTAVTGFTPDEILGKALIDSVHPDDRAASIEQCKPVVDGTADYCRHEVRYLTKDGGYRWVEVHARATRNANGALIGTAGVIRDVTERRQVDEALRTAREVAEAASRAKSEFLSRMSHELRTPLNAILGFGQLTELEATTPTQRENADHILKAGRHLLHLINEVLDITGIESGRLHLSVEPVRVTEAVGEVFELMSPLAAAKSVRLTIDHASVTDRFVNADRQRLKQVLLNVVANAVKYNRENGAAHVSCHESGTGRVRILVADTGPGIAPEKTHRLFTAFDRLGAEQTGIEGTGLGLALSKRLVEAMSGQIGVNSAAGKGSTFWIELPEAENQMARLAALDSDAPRAPRISGPRVKKSTILYVEDNLSNLTLVQRILGLRHDIELIPAMQGGLALELARSHQPDLVLLDLHLPDIPGEEVLKQMRKSSDCRSIPVVVLSADATPGQIDKLLAMGAHSYVTKPLEVRSFIKILNTVLKVREAA
ncbi:MAG TPA: MHYT domain-containing protein [Gemmatimonadaceae bacterium]|nr:MHYT domain-containing protein [Gemmatimonadaceae bacterium]